jgi:hypothetical protein
MQITIKTTTLLKNPTIHIESIETPTFTITPKVPIEGEWEEIGKDFCIFLDVEGEDVCIRMQDVRWDGGRFEVMGEISQYNFNHLINNI